MKIFANIRQSNFAVDSLFVVNSDIIAVILNIMASVVLARILGPEKRGVVATILAVPFLVFPLVSMGLRQTAAYYTGKKIADERSLFATLGLLLILLSGLGVAISLLIGAANGLTDRYGWLAMLLATIFIPFNLWFTITKGILIGKRGLIVIAISTVMIPISYLFLLLPIGFVGEYQVEAVILATVISAAIGAVYISLRFRTFGSLKPNYVPGLPKQLIKLGVVYALSLFIVNLNYRLDVLILERLSNATEVGIYTVAVRLAELLWMIPAALALVNFSYSASAQDQQAQSLRTAKMMRVVLWGALLPGVLLFILAPVIIPFVYGSEFERSGAAVQAILPGIWAALVFKMLNSDLAGRGLPKISLVIYSVGVPINILLCVWWIPSHGSTGASWASSVSYTAVAIMMAITYARVTRIRFGELLLPRKSDFNFIGTMFRLQ